MNNLDIERIEKDGEADANAEYVDLKCMNRIYDTDDCEHVLNDRLQSASREELEAYGKARDKRRCCMEAYLHYKS